MPRPVTHGDLRLILEAAQRRNCRMMILLGSLQGLRVHEIAKIQGQDVDLHNRTLVVNGKGGKIAYLPLHQTVVLFASSFPLRGYWFPSADDPARSVAANSVSRAIKRAMQRADVLGTPHQLRHYFGSTLVQNGVDLRTVQELLRHESLATTQIYTLVTDAARRQAMDTLQVA
ncbi:tyrosine-type recombinase/integrase [Arthrobacter sp. Hz1]